jgi:hypothetical protein
MWCDAMTFGTRAEPCPFIADRPNDIDDVRALLRAVAIGEMRWPQAEVEELLHWPDSVFVGVAVDRRIVAGGQILTSGRPFPVEKFSPGCMMESEVPVEVSPVGIQEEFRRRAQPEVTLSVLDALVKAIYWGCPRDFTDIWALFEPSRIYVFRDVAGISLTIETPGRHYWCRRDHRS